MYDPWADLIILLLRYPHVLERAEACKDRPADPDRVLALRRRDNLDLYRARRERSELLLHAVRDACVHRAAAREHDVAEKVAADVEVALHNRVVAETLDERCIYKFLGGVLTSYPQCQLAQARASMAGIMPPAPGI
jgi:hypothetical protein